LREVDGHILFSASDLMKFMGCKHATILDMARMRGEGPKPRADSEDAALLQKQGDAHEAAHLEKLKTQAHQVVEIASGDLTANAAKTREVLAQGPDVIFQGALVSGNWGGWSDFLERVERPSKLGDFSYEVTDTKLKRTPHPKHVLQLVLYSDLLAEIQGVMPEYAHVELGTGERASLRLKDYSAYARAARQRLEDFVAQPEATRPVPCSDCGLCRWAEHCAEIWVKEDSLFNVANISRTQVKKLEAAGVDTLEALSTLDHPVPKISEPTRTRLVTQARLQQARKTGAPDFMLRPFVPGKGFYLLPKPQAGDLFYDIEGDPHYEGGLEYLHGVWAKDTGFVSFWAHDHAAEKQAVIDLFVFFRTRLAQFPQARIYHYAPYEITALRRLTAKYGVGETFFDRLQRERRFVDLFAVVRGGLIGSEPNYSIKSMEAFYGLVRDGEVKTAGGSVVAYEKWIETGEQKILDEIEDYNRIDCVSTEGLRDWLVGIRPDRPWPEMAEDAGDKEVEEDAEADALRTMLAASNLPEERQAMLFDLGMFHTREVKPAWWAIFDSIGKDEDDLIDDLGALAGLVATGPAEPIKRSVQRTYRFPEQETKLRAGRKATIPTEDGMATISVTELDRAARRITLKIGMAKAEFLADHLTLHPDKPISTAIIADALRDVIADQCGARTYRALDDLLSRRPPRLAPPAEDDILNGADFVEGTINAVARMDETVLPIQGPPGTGKTYVSARAILSLVRAGYRVGVASNSHEAIRNVLMGCLAAVDNEDMPVTLEMAHKVSQGNDGYPEGVDGISRPTSNDDPALAESHVVGGTAFFFAREANIQAFDWLFVDEAGQVGLANLLAMGRSARNIVLVGDPQQLPQVIQGSHPHPANLSCLEWVLGDHATIPPERGIFLPITRRMHPDVCEFISDQAYEGRLNSHPDTARQSVSNTPFPKAGAFWVPVLHEGNAQTAPEEVAAIKAAITDLLRGKWTDKDGRTRKMRASDIIVVAPYNVQVNALAEALPASIRVGTVDKFQGQEAPICLVSMTASSAEETSRGMEFLFSLNRINVAVSRAKALALVFGAPRLREAKCSTVEQMRLVNTLCALETCGGLNG